RLHLFAGQETPRFLIGAPFLGAFRVQRFHLPNLVFGQRRQAGDDVDERPAGALALGRAGPPRRHAREADTVFDDREELPIGARLRGAPAHVWRTRIQAAADGRLSAAVVPVAHGAVVGEVL